MELVFAEAKSGGGGWGWFLGEGRVVVEGLGMVTINQSICTTFFSTYQISTNDFRTERQRPREACKIELIVHERLAAQFIFSV